MFDAHTHLNSDQLYPDRKKHTYEFIAAGGTHLVSVGIDTVYNTRNLSLCEERRSDPQASQCMIKCSVGIHPCSVGSEGHATKQQISEQLNIIKSQIKNSPQHIVAVGECGIDAHRGEYSAVRDLQIWTFVQQCEIAREYDLPIIIHTRSQRSDTLEVLQDFSDLKIYLHCRGYTSDEITQAVEALPHLWIGFCGNTTYPKAFQLRESLTTAREFQAHGKCNVLIETDAPYLAPQTRRGKQNVPAYLLDHGRLLAQHLEISSIELFETTTTNAKTLYGLF